jgi:hypothetical protein
MRGADMVEAGALEEDAAASGEEAGEENTTAVDAGYRRK